MHYGIIEWVVVGLIAGLLAKWITRDNPGGLIVTILIGIAGGLIGGFAASELDIEGGHLVNIALATAGAVLLLLLYRLMGSRRPA